MLHVSRPPSRGPLRSHRSFRFGGAAPFALAAAIVALPGCFLTQGGSGELELDVAQCEVTATLDKETYGIGEPIVVTVAVKNVGDQLAVLPMPGRDICELYARPVGGNEETIQLVEYLSSPLDLPSFSEVMQEESVDRALLAYRFARHAGKYELFARYRTEERAISQAVEVVSLPVQFTIDANVVFDRDREGRLTDVEAMRVARAHFKADPAAAAETLLATDETKVDVWLVTVRTAGADGVESDRSCLVSPFNGKVRREVKTTVASERAKPR